MSTPIDFYFDFASPYGYFAAQQIDQLGARYGRAVEWHPVLLGVVFKQTGAAPLTHVPLKGTYSLHDFERTARFHGIAFQMPQPFPIATHAAARAMLWLRAQHGKARAVEFAKAAYRAYFVDGVQIGEAANLAPLVAGLGLDAAALNEAISSAAIKEQLKHEVEQAIACGVFGSPFMIVDGEAFWGFDRFTQLEAYLRDGKIEMARATNGEAPYETRL